MKMCSFCTANHLADAAVAAVRGPCPVQVRQTRPRSFHIHSSSQFPPVLTRSPPSPSDPMDRLGLVPLDLCCVVMRSRRSRRTRRRWYIIPLNAQRQHEDHARGPHHARSRVHASKARCWQWHWQQPCLLVEVNNVETRLDTSDPPAESHWGRKMPASHRASALVLAAEAVRGECVGWAALAARARALSPGRAVT